MSRIALASLLDGSTSFITDGGLETTLIFLDGLDLPSFAAFPLVDDAAGRQALARYFQPYFGIAERDGVGMVVDTPTYRANPDWAALVGYEGDALAGVQTRSVEFARAIAADHEAVPTVINGLIGQRGDGYVINNAMSVSEAADYHLPQVRVFSEAGVDMVLAATMSYVEEAIGIAEASASVGVPVVISFTLETDGRLPSGQTLGEAIEATDRATDSGPAYYMINCAHPSHFQHVLDSGSDWLQRIGSVRANASRMSHKELDNADALDRGDPEALASDYIALRSVLPGLRVVGGCCGTDHEHIGRISAGRHTC